MEDHLEGFSDNIFEWESIRHMTDLELDDPMHNIEKVDYPINRFPRAYYVMYGMMPKMEPRIYIKCRLCKLIFSPFSILYHKSCVRLPSSTEDVAPEKKTKNTISNSKRNGGYGKVKKTLKSLKVINQVTSNLKIQETNQYSDAEIKGISIDAPSPSCLSNESLTFDCDSSSPIKNNLRNSKKSRKIKLSKEFDPDIHCGVVDSHKGPCLRSITCSNHRIQLKKNVPGRSKAIHQLIAEKRLAKERDLFNHANPENDTIENFNVLEHLPVITPTNLEEINELVTSEVIDTKETVISSNDEFEEITLEIKHSPEFIEDFQNFNKIQNLKLTSGSSTMQENIEEVENFDSTVISSVKEEKYFATLDNYLLSSRDDFNQEESVHLIEKIDFNDIQSMPSIKEEYNVLNTKAIELAHIQPMSPLEKEFPANQETFLSDPFENVSVVQNNDTFKIPDLEVELTRGSYPRAIVLPNYGLKTIGGGIIFDKSQLQIQRNDILKAVNDCRVNFSLFDGSSFSKTKRNYNLTLSDSDIDYKQMRLDPNLNHFLMQCEIKKPFDDVLLEECLQENFGRNTFTSTIDFE